MAEFMIDIVRGAPGAVAAIALLLLPLAIGVAMIVAATALIAVRSLHWPAEERRDARRMVETLGTILVCLVRGTRR